MASINLLLIVLLVLFSLSMTSVYSLSTRDAVSIQDDESYFMATNDQGSSMIDVEDLTKARSLQSLVARSKVVVNKRGSSSRSSTKSSKKKKKNKSKKIGASEVFGLILLIIIAIVLTIAFIRLLYVLYDERKTKKAIAHAKIKGSSETHTSKTQDYV